MRPHTRVEARPSEDFQDLAQGFLMTPNDQGKGRRAFAPSQRPKGAVLTAVLGRFKDNWNMAFSVFRLALNPLLTARSTAIPLFPAKSRNAGMFNKIGKFRYLLQAAIVLKPVLARTTA